MAKRRRSARTAGTAGRASGGGGATVAAGPVPVGAAASRRTSLLWIGIILAGTVLAYSNSFSGPFIFDGKQSITDNPYVRRLWPITEAMKAPPQTTVSGRPVVSLSLAANYRISVLDVGSYHAFNLTVHVLAALLLFGVVRRTLLTDRLRGRFGGASAWLAGLCALIWAVHPLLTQAVTYVVQRAESMMGMLYLLTLYCAIRSFHSSRRSGMWSVASVIACVVGMATKEVMATAPLVVLVYDWVFVAGSLKKALTRRWALYAGLAATWVMLAVLVATGPRSRSAGFGMKAITPIQYARAQCLVIPHYIRLAFWPDPLVLDYARKIPERLGDYAPGGAVVLVLLAGVAGALRYRPSVGFLGVWFFVILGPTSSFLPIADVAFEQRMYLPLAAMIVGTVVGGFALLRRGLGASLAARVAGLTLAVGVAAALAAATHDRNYDYRSAETIWRDTANKQPDSFRAFSSLGVALANAGNYSDAFAACGRSVELNPEFPYTHNGLGVALYKMGRHDEAIASFTKAIECWPEYSRAYANRAGLWQVMGQPARAVADATKAIELDPRYAPIFHTRGVAYAALGKYDKAIADYDRAIRLDRRYVQAYCSRAAAWTATGDLDRTVADFSTAIDMAPNRARTYCDRGLAYLTAKRQDRAIADFTKAIELNGRLAKAYDGRAVAHARMERFDEALADVDKALELDPNFEIARNNRGAILSRRRASSN